jgi:hypothetical protein
VTATADRTATDRPAPPIDLIPQSKLAKLRPAATVTRIQRMRESGKLTTWRLGGQRSAFISLAEWDALFTPELVQPPSDDA